MISLLLQIFEFHNGHPFPTCSQLHFRKLNICDVSGPRKGFEVGFLIGYQVLEIDQRSVRVLTLSLCISVISHL